MTFNFIELAIELTLYIVMLKIICIFKDFLASIDESTLAESDLGYLKQKKRFLRVMIIVILVTMLVSSTYQASGPFLYISDTFSKNSKKV